jgi:hypothetical protein
LWFAKLTQRKHHQHAYSSAMRDGRRAVTPIDPDLVVKTVLEE